MLLETFFEKGELNQMMFVLLLLFYLLVCVEACSHTQIDLKHFNSV